MQWSVAEWSPEYGDPHGFGAEEESGAPPTVWEHSSLRAVDCAPRGDLRLAFVDGTRQLEARLYLQGDGAETVAGLAGVISTGAVVPSPGGRLAFQHLRIQRRLVVCGGGRQGPQLPPQPGGWKWQSVALESDDPQAAQTFLQQSMRDMEAELAYQLALQGNHVVLDGPLHGQALLDPRPGLIVGYVKTQHRQLFSGDDELVITSLRGGQRTSAFHWNRRQAVYLRLLGEATLEHHPWFATVRLEVSQALPEGPALAALTQVAGALPRFCSHEHCDPRAPQNLQPVAALERELRRRAGDRKLGLRAIRQAVGQWSQTGGRK